MEILGWKVGGKVGEISKKDPVRANTRTSTPIPAAFLPGGAA
jgi:hypothetical protein